MLAALVLRGIVNQPLQHRRVSARGCCAYLFALPPRARPDRLHGGRAGIAGTPKGRLTKLEKSLLTKPWAVVRDQVTVKLLDQDGELYVLARSAGRQDKERAMRRRRLKRLCKRLQELPRQGNRLTPP